MTDAIELETLGDELIDIINQKINGRILTDQEYENLLSNSGGGGADIPGVDTAPQGSVLTIVGGAAVWQLPINPPSNENENGGGGATGPTFPDLSSANVIRRQFNYSGLDLPDGTIVAAMTDDKESVTKSPVGAGGVFNAAGKYVKMDTTVSYRDSDRALFGDVCRGGSYTIRYKRNDSQNYPWIGGCKISAGSGILIFRRNPLDQTKIRVGVSNTDTIVSSGSVTDNLVKTHTFSFHQFQNILTTKYYIDGVLNETSTTATPDWTGPSDFDWATNGMPATSVTSAGDMDVFYELFTTGALTDADALAIHNHAASL